MSGTLSPSMQASCARRVQWVGALVMAAVWVALLLTSLFDHGPVDDASACRRMIYRDPVTGREQGIGEARIALDGTMRCQNVSY